MRRSKSYLEERERQILSMVNQQKVVSVEQIAQRFDISLSTVRKQLNTLHERGLLIRTYGGAEAGNAAAMDNTLKNLDAKRRVAQLAREQIHDGELVMIGAGSTTVQLATLLYDAQELTVFTNSIMVAAETIKNPNIETRICGGIVRPTTGGIFGPQSADYFKDVHADKAFISPDSISAQFGVGDTNALVSYSQRAMILSVETLFIVADHTKVGLKTYSNRLASLDEVDCLITNAEADQETLAEMIDAGIKVLLA